MFKLFFVLTLSSALAMWYVHEYYPEKFFQALRNFPYAGAIINQIHLYLKTSPIITSRVSKIKVFTLHELKEYNGEKDSKGTFLSILGNVYNVEKGKKHYGPGGPYHFFVGKDASRAFITGDFINENAQDDVLDLSPSELLSLRDWSKFYETEYEFKGKLHGKYYDENGKKTQYWYELNKKLNEAEKAKKGEKDEELVFPPCNVEWNADTGTKVWCSNKSGGIERNWAGVPRKLYMIGSESYRCACIDTNEIQNTKSPQYARRRHLESYEHCDPQQHTCFIRE